MILKNLSHLRREDNAKTEKDTCYDIKGRITLKIEFQCECQDDSIEYYGIEVLIEEPSHLRLLIMVSSKISIDEVEEVTEYDEEESYKS